LPEHPDSSADTTTPVRNERPGGSLESPANGVSKLRPPWIPIAAACGLALLALFFDQRITDYLTDEHVRQRIIQIFWIPVALFFYIFMLAVLASFPNRWRLSEGFLAAVLLSALLTHLLKWAVGRARPQTDVGSFCFRPFRWIEDVGGFTWGGDFASFPSGHSSAAATLAVLLGIYFPRARWVFYFFAGIIGLERLINDKHYLSDVLAGFALGALSVYFCVRVLGPHYYQRELPH
jgi:membrane-associated phospholipid phosphatase